MKISRGIPIHSRIITENDLKRFLTIFQNEYHSLCIKSKNISIKFRVRFEDNTIIESSDSNELLDSQFLKTKRVISIDFSIDDFANKHSMGLSLSHGDSNYDNLISVQSEDDNWTSALIKRLQESVDACAPQMSFIFKHKGTVEFILTLGIARLFLWVLDLIPIRPVQNTPGWAIGIKSFFIRYPFIPIILQYFLIFPSAWFVAEWIFAKVKNFWPSIEFQIGPQHFYLEKKRRDLVFAIITLIFLPLILSIIYDILKK